MQAQDYATVAVAVMTIVGGFVAAVRWLVKHYLNELKPNGGSSVKDSVARLERQVEEIYRILLTGNKS
jgi:H+/Cl- antiporter ClcA